MIGGEEGMISQRTHLLVQWANTMERVSITERPDGEKAHEYGFNFHTMYGEPYWCEDAYYKLTLAQVEKLEEVTAELHQMCLKVVGKK